MAKINLDHISKENLATNITISKEGLLSELKIMKIMIDGDANLATTTRDEILKIIRRTDQKNVDSINILWGIYDDLDNSVASTKRALTKINNLYSNLEG